MVSWEGKRIQCQSEDGFCEDGLAFKPAGKNCNRTQHRWTLRTLVPTNTVWILSHVIKGLGMLKSNRLYPHSVIGFMKKITFQCYSKDVFFFWKDNSEFKPKWTSNTCICFRNTKSYNIITLLQTLCCSSIDIIWMAIRKLQLVFTVYKIVHKAFHRLN